MRSNPSAVQPTLPVPAMGEVLEFMRLLWAMDHGLHSSSKRMVRNVGVTGPQRMVLRLLGSCPGLGAGELARLLHLHPSTLTGVLQRLERKGLIQRDADPSDGRRIRLRLTPEGEVVDADRRDSVEAAVARALDGLSERSIAEAVKVLLAIAEELGVERPL